ncbi:MAG TPA: NAD-dependent epimerase/dehydratase family protein [Leptospiraceae bacterium]|nr:NAD-dependent epimerase/dehydratase family protein [Leptospiraceae bacterium]
MKILVTGATGLVGAEVLREAIKDRGIEQAIALTRRPGPVVDAKIHSITHTDFLDYSGVNLREVDAIIWCLGVSQSQVNKEQYEVITHDYAVAAGKALLLANPAGTFVFLSGTGADSSEQTNTIFGRVKGKTENSLRMLNFKRYVIARPGGIRPIHKNPNAPLVNKIFIPFFPLFRLIAPSLVIDSDVLARILIHVARNGSDKEILENTDLLEIAERFSL